MTNAQVFGFKTQASPDGQSISQTHTRMEAQRISRHPNLAPRDPLKEKKNENETENKNKQKFVAIDSSQSFH